MNNFHRSVAMAFAFATGAAQAQMNMPMPAASAPAEYTDAEVRKVDKDNARITLKHGEIKNLSMPPMTMVFDTRDAKLLDNVKAGDKVRFKAVNDGGKMTVVDIQKLK